MSNHKKVRDWLMSGNAGLHIGANPQAVLQSAWGASGGLSMSLGEFTDHLHREGFRPDQVGGRWQLNLPDRPNK